MRSKTISLALVACFILLYIVLLGARPMVIPDEFRYAEISREMVEAGDWVVPHLNGLRYFEKPVLGYWLNATSIWLFGENAFAIRLTSAVAVGITALLLFMWASQFSDDDTSPLFATVMFLLSFEVLAVGTFCVLDSLLSLFVTAAIVALYLACQQKAAHTKAVLLLLAGVACGLAFLTKGFLALVIPILVIVPFSLWQGQFKRFLLTSWLAFVPAILVVLPWAIMVHRREPDFWHYFFWVEHVDRFISPHGGQHPEPFWYYIPILLGGAMPWTPLAGPIVTGLRHTSWKHPMVRLAICWLVPPFLFFSACSGKLGTYILPCYPPLAFLIAVGVLRCLRKGDTKGFVIGAWVVLSAVGLLLIALLVGLAAVPQLSDSVALWKWAVAAAGLFLWGALCWAAICRKEIHRRLLLYCVGPMLFMFSWPLIVPAALKAKKTPGAFLLSHATRISDDCVLVAENGLTAAVCWYYGRDDVYILGDRGEYAYGLGYADSGDRLLDIAQLKNMIAEQGKAGCVVLIIQACDYAEYKELLPNPSHEEIYDGLTWIEYAPTPESATTISRLPD